MRLLADAHVKPAYVNALESHGHDVVTVQEALRPDATDEEVIRYARSEERVVLTNDDKDFTEFEAHSGVLFVPQDMVPGNVETAVSRIDHQFDDLSNSIQYLRHWI
jgi:predicted nuclease of predicted toxin-antitoxin system